MQAPAASSTSPELLQKSAYQHLTEHTLRFAPVFPLTEARFIAMAEKARRDLPGLAYQLSEWIKQLFDLRQKILASPKRYPGLERDLDRLAGGDFPATTPHARMPHIVRYLKAVQIRAERAAVSPAKDAEKGKQLAPFTSWEARVAAPNREAFRWMLEEFRVSLFAQELGTAQPASAARLKALAEM